MWTETQSNSSENNELLEQNESKVKLELLKKSSIQLDKLFSADPEIEAKLRKIPYFKSNVIRFLQDSLNKNTLDKNWNWSLEKIDLERNELELRAIIENIIAKEVWKLTEVKKEPEIQVQYNKEFSKDYNILQNILKELINWMQDVQKSMELNTWIINKWIDLIAWWEWKQAYQNSIDWYKKQIENEVSKFEKKFGLSPDSLNKKLEQNKSELKIWIAPTEEQLKQYEILLWQKEVLLNRGLKSVQFDKMVENSYETVKSWEVRDNAIAWMKWMWEIWVDMAKWVFDITLLLWKYLNGNIWRLLDLAWIDSSKFYIDPKNADEIEWQFKSIQTFLKWVDLSSLPWEVVNAIWKEFTKIWQLKWAEQAEAIWKLSWVVISLIWMYWAWKTLLSKWAEIEAWLVENAWKAWEVAISQASNAEKIIKAERIAKKLLERGQEWSIRAEKVQNALWKLVEENFWLEKTAQLLSGEKFLLYKAQTVVEILDLVTNWAWEKLIWAVLSKSLKWSLLLLKKWWALASDQISQIKQTMKDLSDAKKTTQNEDVIKFIDKSVWTLETWVKQQDVWKIENNINHWEAKNDPNITNEQDLNLLKGKSHKFISPNEIKQWMEDAIGYVDTKGELLINSEKWNKLSFSQKKDFVAHERNHQVFSRLTDNRMNSLLSDFKNNPQWTWLENHWKQLMWENVSSDPKNIVNEIVADTMWRLRVWEINDFDKQTLKILESYPEFSDKIRELKNTIKNESLNPNLDLKEAAKMWKVDYSQNYSEELTGYNPDTIHQNKNTIDDKIATLRWKVKWANPEKEAELRAEIDYLENLKIELDTKHNNWKQESIIKHRESKVSSKYSNLEQNINDYNEWDYEKTLCFLNKNLEWADSIETKHINELKSKLEWKHQEYLEKEQKVIKQQEKEWKIKQDIENNYKSFAEYDSKTYDININNIQVELNRLEEELNFLNFRPTANQSNRTNLEQSIDYLKLLEKDLNAKHESFLKERTANKELKRQKSPEYIKWNLEELQNKLSDLKNQKAELESQLKNDRFNLYNERLASSETGWSKIKINWNKYNASSENPDYLLPINNIKDINKEIFSLEMQVKDVKQNLRLASKSEKVDNAINLNNNIDELAKQKWITNDQARLELANENVFGWEMKEEWKNAIIKAHEVNNWTETIWNYKTHSLGEKMKVLQDAGIPKEKAKELIFKGYCWAPEILDKVGITKELKQITIGIPKNPETILAELKLLESWDINSIKGALEWLEIWDLNTPMRSQLLENIRKKWIFWELADENPNLLNLFEWWVKMDSHIISLLNQCKDLKHFDILSKHVTWAFLPKYEFKRAEFIIKEWLDFTNETPNIQAKIKELGWDSIAKINNENAEKIFSLHIEAKTWKELLEAWNRLIEKWGKLSDIANFIFKKSPDFFENPQDIINFVKQLDNAKEIESLIKSPQLQKWKDFILVKKQNEICNALQPWTEYFSDLSDTFYDIAEEQFNAYKKEFPKNLIIALEKS